MRRISITSPSQETPSMTTPTPDRPTVDDSSKFMDTSQLQVPDGHGLAWSDTDYGISKMSETVALPYADIQNHLSRCAGSLAGRKPGFRREHVVPHLSCVFLAIALFSSLYNHGFCPSCTIFYLGIIIIDGYSGRIPCPHNL